MPASHHIDDLNRLIITDWKGGADLDKFIHSYQKYCRKIRNQQRYNDYNEVVNFTGLTQINFNFQDLKKMAKLTVILDQSDSKKLAMIANPGLAYVLANGYVTFRKVISENRKEVRVFQDYFKALKWINSEG